MIQIFLGLSKQYEAAFLPLYLSIFDVLTSFCIIQKFAIFDVLTSKKHCNTEEEKE